MRRFSLSALAAIALMVALAGPAMAGKPSKVTFVDEGSFSIDCGTFSLLSTYTDRITVKEWTDSSGAVTRLQAHHSYRGTITGPGGILELSDPGNFTDFVTFGPDGETVRQVGMVYKLIAKGHGLIAHDVGVITFHADGSVTTQGPHDVWDNGLEALICPLFED